MTSEPGPASDAEVEALLDQINEWGHMPPGNTAVGAFEAIADRLRALMRRAPRVQVPGQLLETAGRLLAHIKRARDATSGEDQHRLADVWACATMDGESLAHDLLDWHKSLRDGQEPQQPALSEHQRWLDPYRARLRKLEDFANKVDEIRLSIIGRQSMNWSMHAYPLVTALKEIGKEGLGHDEAKALAEKEVERFRREVLADEQPETPPAPDPVADAIDRLTEAVQVGFHNLGEAKR